MGWGLGWASDGHFVKINWIVSVYWFCRKCGPVCMSTEDRGDGWSLKEMWFDPSIWIVRGNSIKDGMKT